MSVTTLDGERLELWGQESLRELTVLVTHSPVDCDCCGDGGELTLARDQVLALRDELTAWLARGEL